MIPEQYRQPKKNNKPLFISAALLMLSLGFAFGYFVGNWENIHSSAEKLVKKEIINQSEKEDISSDIDFNLFWEVWNNVKQKYVGQPVDERKMFYGALAGIVASLEDPYSIYLDPELSKTFNEEISGTFEGIGAEIDIKDDQLMVVAPLKNTPAERSGLKPQDAILAIDGVDTAGMNLDYAIKLIRGAKGSTVTLIIKRGEEDPQEIPIVRDVIQIDSVTWEIKEQDGQKIGYINITSFNDDTSSKFNQAVNEILLAQPAGLVLDLRNNPGGLLEQSIEISSRFISNGVVVYEEFSDGSKQEYKALGNPSLQGIKTVVLINGGSASASEIVAGALQDYGLATLIGEKTFGKGSVQDLVDFNDGSSLKITVAKWFTPEGRCIQEKGIDPDEVIEQDYDPNAEDKQLQRALDFLIGT
jgi:carboxyl-terminal processing protease